MKIDKKVQNISPRGGDNKECGILSKEGQTVECLPNVRDLMEEFLRQIENIKRSDVARIIAPSECNNSSFVIG